MALATKNNYPVASWLIKNVPNGEPCKCETGELKSLWILMMPGWTKHGMFISAADSHGVLMRWNGSWGTVSYVAGRENDAWTEHEHGYLFSWPSWVYPIVCTRTWFLTQTKLTTIDHGRLWTIMVDHDCHGWPQTTIVKNHGAIWLNMVQNHELIPYSAD